MAFIFYKKGWGGLILSLAVNSLEILLIQSKAFDLLEQEGKHH
jgi:hypothetical protein